MSFKIKGTIRYINLGSGFWGIESDTGKKYMPIPMPEQLKFDGYSVECKAEETDVMTIHMWGEPVKIVSFETINPRN